MSITKTTPKTVTLPPGVSLLEAEIQVCLHQDGDSSDGGDCQYLEISTTDAGGGRYLILTTERWAVDGEDIADFCSMLQAILHTEIPIMEATCPCEKGDEDADH